VRPLNVKLIVYYELRRVLFEKAVVDALGDKL
jgi:hypothetical protein